MVTFPAPSGEGKQCVRNVPGWQKVFMDLIQNQESAPLVKLVATVAHHEVCESFV